jgi:hypothetical protein
MRVYSNLKESGDISFYSQSTLELAQRTMRKSS